jgi:hypothetical protein
VGHRGAFGDAALEFIVEFGHDVCDVLGAGDGDGWGRRVKRSSNQSASAVPGAALWKKYELG